MKSIINRIFIASALTFSLSACSDFLNKEPLSQGTEAIVFKTPEHFEQAAYYLYDLYGWDYNAMDRNLDISGLGSNGGGTAPESSGSWGGPYGQIRDCNILLEKAEEYARDKNAISHAVGTAHFFRAWQYFKLLKTYGGVPIADHSLDLTDPTLQAPRNSRYEVANFIINDLKEAVKLLTKEKDIPDADKGKISKEAAQSFLARVALYEGTWEKYVPSIGYDLDGDGTNSGAGTAKPEGYPSVTELLTLAKTMSKDVITEAETGTFKLWNECDSLSYYYLFNIDDAEGNIPNFKGKGKATNKEFIIYRKYDFNIAKPNKNISHTVIVGLATSISQQFGESFLCRNGLPIRICYTGNMANAQNNPQFEGYKTFVGEYRNRDYRFISCTYIPDRTFWSSRVEDGRQLTATGKPYPDPVFPQNDEVYNPGDPAYSSSCGVFKPTLRNNSTASGYGSRKYLIEGANRPSNTESADYPNLRLAEVHCIYAEATCELNGGNISDEDLDFSINKNRARARVAPLTNALIANVWDAGYWDYEQNKTVCKKMNMLDEIRRERACELFGEGHRMDDLKRWGIAHINLVGQKLGHYVLGTAYETEKANSAQYFGEPCYYPEKYPLRYGIYEGTGKNDPDYGRSIANDPTTLNFIQRDYLTPLPLDQMRLNTNLKQNPGW
ncbi:RagB/SusD family nutrient uptake outer membrane protein [Bacteroides intestinalis]|uniref:RagB/SusD family nutrient uptake outer membrane protein n=1 Tax=Bacteroides intestinalis TaxID=329854 RepID=A0AB37M8N0_9BACE|nr:RagB/SusD family nutrient uptake outer membrane protein [Bacteroides intestinalis]RHN04762.1 RagB/SusD family nutrient uptake outer membrane protein [Bacteroides intestinalis]